MIDKLTEKELSVLNYLENFIKAKGYPPSIREIQSGLDIKSTSTVSDYLKCLEEKNFIRRIHSKNRAIEILDYNKDEISKKETLDAPILGKVQAGEPIYSVENIEDYFPLPIEYASTGNIFVLKVQGDSMIDVGIFDGDFIIVREQAYAENGEIVVALLNDSTTVKRFYKREDYIELMPENSSMQSILVRDVRILGKVIGLYRKHIH